MKKFQLGFIALFLGLALCTNAYADLGKILQATFAWEKTDYNFGKVEHNQPVTTEFEFTNVGSTPLIIKDAQGSCGCTVPAYPKEPIAPGAVGKIKVSFNASTLGVFNKTVTITANTDKQTVLNIRGEVVAKAQ
jgi:hypothetical protein